MNEKSPTKVDDHDRIALTEACNEAIRRQDFGTALRIIESLLADRLIELADCPWTADRLDFQLILNAGDLRTSLSDEVQGIRHYERAGFLAFYHESGRMMSLVQAKIAFAAMQAGDFERAEEALDLIGDGLPGKAVASDSIKRFVDWEQRLPWVHSDRGGVLAHIYWALSRYIAGNGKFDAAAKCLDRAEHHVRKAEQSAHRSSVVYELEVNLKLDRIHFFLQCGNLFESEELLAHYASNPLEKPKPYLVIRLLELQARLSLLQGKLRRCRKILEQIIDRVKEMKQPLYFGRAVLNLCHFLVLINQTAKAQKLLRDTCGILPAKDYERLKLHFDHAQKQAEMKKLSAEISPTQPLQEIYDTNDGPTEAFLRSINLMGSPEPVKLHGSFYDFEAQFNVEAAAFRYALINSDRPKEVYALLEEINRRYGDTNSDLVLGRLALMQGMFFMRLFELEGAVHCLETAREHFSACNIPFEIWQSLSLLTICYLILGRRRQAETATRKAEGELIRLTKDLEQEELDLFMLDKWNFEEQALRVDTDHLAELTRRIQSVRWWRKPSMWVRAASLVVNILRKSSRFRGKEVHRILDLDEKQASTVNSDSLVQFMLRHSPRLASVSFLCLSDRTLVVSRSFLRLHWKLTATKRSEIRRGVRWWHRLAHSWLEQYYGHLWLPDERFGQKTEKSVRVMSRISNRIAEKTGFLPVLRKLPFWVKEVKINPDDALHVMPFAAIWSDGSYLFQKFRVRFSYSLSAGGSARSESSEALIVDIGGEIDEPGFPRLPDLPMAKEEADLIEGILSGDFRCNVVRYPQAAPDASTLIPTILDSLSRKQFVHIACHGLFNKSAPYKSGLVLLPPKGKVEILSVRDIANAGALSVDCLCLSACYSADVFTLPGRWVVGLPEAFCRAGVENVIGFLWPVEDRTGSALMTALYPLIKKKSIQQAVEVLRRMCFNRELDHVGDLPTFHPFFWASLNIYTRS